MIKTLSVSLLCCACLAGASTITMTFDGVNGAAAFGYYVGTYYGTMDGSPVDLFCVDFANTVWIGQTWQANLSAITAGADLSRTRYGNLAGALALYEQEAWLSEQLLTQPTKEYGDIQATMWQLFNPDAPTPSSSYWLHQAQQHYAAGDYSDFRVITNLQPVERTGQVQEFITRVNGDAAPESSTSVLMGIALVGLGIALKRARRRSAIARV